MAFYLAAILVSPIAVYANSNSPFLPLPVSINEPFTFSNLTSCLSETPFYSCENTTAITNTCCSPTPGGLVLQTQYWNTYTGMEDVGQLLPKNSWTIHGLWPDNCDGSYDQYCDLSRQYDPYPSPNTTNGLPNGTVVPPYSADAPTIDTFIKEFGRYDLLNFMELFYTGQGMLSKYFWAHEFSKHATCTSCFDTNCYSNYKEHEEVVDFFDSVKRAFLYYPTYKTLASHGILPSNQTTYTLAQLENAIKSQTGAIPYFGCYGEDNTVLDEIWYYNHVIGCEQAGHFKTIDSTDSSSCNETGIWYYEPTPTSVRDVDIDLVAL